MNINNFMLQMFEIKRTQFMDEKKLEERFYNYI